MRKPIWIAGAGIAIAVIAIVLSRQQERSPPEPTVTARASSTAPKNDVDVVAVPGRMVAASASNPVGPVTTPPIPLDARLTDIYAALKARADAGEPKAQCRFAFEVQRCSTQLPLAQKQLVMFQGELGKPNRSAELRADLEQTIQSLGAWIERASKVCVGFEAKETDAPWRYLGSAAQSGHLPSLRTYLLAQNIGLDRFNMMTTATGWAEFKESLPSMLRLALQSGDPEAMNLAAMYYGGPTFGTQMVPQDPITALSIKLALRRIATPDSAGFLDNQIAVMKQYDHQFTPQEEAAAADRATAMAGQIRVPEGGFASAKTRPMFGNYAKDCGA